MRIAIEKKGILTGLYLGFVRLIRCNLGEEVAMIPLKRINNLNLK